MIVVVRKDHPGEGQFPTFQKGSVVTNVQPCIAYEFWKSCTIDGYDTYIPVDYIKDGLLTINYDPTELILKKDDCVTVHRIVYDWAYAETKDGVFGWVPFGILSTK